MPGLVIYAISAVLLAAAACAASACGSANTISGEVQFHRDVDLPEGATITVKLLDTSSPTPPPSNWAAM